MHKEEFNKHNNKHNTKHNKTHVNTLEVLLNMLNKRIQIHLEKKSPKQNRQRNEQKQQKHQNIILIIKMGEHQIIEQRQNREQELHQRKALVNYYRHFPLENQHLEITINPNMVILSRNMNQKENQVDHQILNLLITE